MSDFKAKTHQIPFLLGFRRNPPPDVDKKLSYCWETVRRESMPRIAEMDLEMTI